MKMDVRYKDNFNSVKCHEGQVKILSKPRGRRKQLLLTARIVDVIRCNASIIFTTMKISTY